MLFPFILTQGEGAVTYSLPSSSANNGTRMSKGQVLKKVFDPTNSAIKCVDAGTASGSNGTNLDVNQVWQSVYDPTNSAIRVVFV
jgi:hypothetical protein